RHQLRGALVCAAERTGDGDSYYVENAPRFREPRAVGNRLSETRVAPMAVGYGSESVRRPRISYLRGLQVLLVIAPGSAANQPLHLTRRDSGSSGFNVSPAAAQVNGSVRAVIGSQMYKTPHIGVICASALRWP